jgi:hypothetical protein
MNRYYYILALRGQDGIAYFRHCIVEADTVEDAYIKGDKIADFKDWRSVATAINDLVLIIK